MKEIKAKKGEKVILASDGIYDQEKVDPQTLLSWLRNSMLKNIKLPPVEIGRIVSDLYMKTVRSSSPLDDFSLIITEV